MPKRQSITVFQALCVLAAAAALSGCSHAGEAPATTASAPAPETTASVAGPVTRERASTDCWMKLEGSGLGLDQRLALVEKCTAERMKQAAH